MSEFVQLKDDEPTAEEKALLDHELELFRENPDSGSPWPEVKMRLRKRASC